MSRTLRQITVLITSTLFLLTMACTTIKPVYDVGVESYASQLQAGDRVRLTYLDGRIQDIDVTAVSATEIKGKIHKNTLREPRGFAVSADWRDIHAVETIKISPVKTAGAAVGVIVAIPIIALGALLMGAGAG